MGCGCRWSVDGGAVLLHPCPEHSDPLGAREALDRVLAASRFRSAKDALLFLEKAYGTVGKVSHGEAREVLRALALGYDALKELAALAGPGGPEGAGQHGG
jgi:hypothetical protein